VGTYQSIYEQIGTDGERKDFREQHAFTDIQADVIKNSVKELLFGRLSKDVMRIVEAICPAETQREAVKVLILDAMRRREGRLDVMLNQWLKKAQSTISVESITMGSSAGQQSVCKKCGKPFNQAWLKELEKFTRYETCDNCRTANTIDVDRLAKEIINKVNHV